jgi:Flp pilus assembly pilin Flp
VQHVIRLILGLSRDRRGAATYEYGLLAAAIMLGSLVAAQSLGFGVNSLFGSVANATAYSGPVTIGGNLPPGSVDPLPGNTGGATSDGTTGGTTGGTSTGGTSAGGTTTGGSTTGSTTGGTTGGTTTGTTGGTATGGTTGNGNAGGNGNGNGGGTTTAGVTTCPAGQRLVGNRCR